MPLHDTSRRTFLKSGLALAAALPGARAFGHEPEPVAGGVPVGLQLYSVRQHMPKDVPGTLARIRAMGFREVEGGGDYGLGIEGFLAELKKAGASVDVWDPWVSAREAREEYGISLVKKLGRARYDAVVLAVPHREFTAMKPAAVRRLAKRRHVIYDVKHLFDRGQSDGRL